MALIGCRAALRRSRASASPRLACLSARTSISVVALRAVRPIREAARARSDIAGPRGFLTRVCRDTIRILRAAAAHRRRRADPTSAGIPSRAGSAVIAGAAFRLHWIGADTGHRVANTCLMTLILRRALHRGRRRALSGLAGLARGALRAVIARGIVRFGGLGADSSCGITHSIGVALIERRARHQ